METKLEELNVEELNDVTGGTGNGRNCWFEPESPLFLTGEGDRRRVKCKSFCSAGCGCHGTHHCEGKMHLVENAPEGARELWAYPKNQNNHSESRKRILLP